MLLNLLYPKRCVGCNQLGQYFCSQCKTAASIFTHSICPVCHHHALSGQTHPRCLSPHSLNGLVSIFGYRGPIRRAIKKLKFRFVTNLIDEFVSFSLETVADNPVFLKFSQSNFTLTPVPLHPQRHRWRGFNQADEIGRLLASHLKLPYNNLLLSRQRNTHSQSELNTQLSRQEILRLKNQSLSQLDYLQKSAQFLSQKKLQARHANIKGAFALHQPSIPKQIVLVDDVWTSGATIKECAKVLKRNGAQSVWAFTLAR